MAILLTIDASVFVAACHRREPGHVASRRLLAAVRDAGTPLLEPASMPVEVAAALSRAGGDANLAREYAAAIIALPRLTLVAIDEELMRRAVDLAADRRLRGADAMYATVASLYGARLVTLDGEQMDRSPPGASACRPEDAMLPA